MSRASITGEDGRCRCGWCGGDPLYMAYHDTEWGVPEWDDRALFEKLILDGFQAGLSWITILRKRENFRRAFDGFQPEKIARYTPKKLDALMQDAGIVRNRAKIEGSVANARGWLDIMEKEGSFAEYLWHHVGGKPKQNAWASLKQVPAETKESQAISKDLRKRGFTFVGPTIVYAFMQAVGMVNDHTVDCFRHRQVKKLGR
ncbi:MAG TPA: DNA-3-methyladenine glycosylase I [Ferrovibrio sp.]|uniref:DNA-3-methyladenine glycosylase I n=1 Tax=Ferrovibrio sp. TaxID=1917215 RepID=UPI002ED12D52